MYILETGTNSDCTRETHDLRVSCHFDFFFLHRSAIQTRWQIMHDLLGERYCTDSEHTQHWGGAWVQDTKSTFHTRTQSWKKSRKTQTRNNLDNNKSSVRNWTRCTARTDTEMWAAFGIQCILTVPPNRQKSTKAARTWDSNVSYNLFAHKKPPRR